MTLFERTYEIIKKPWVIATYILFIIFIYLVVDRPLAIYLHSLNLRVNLHILNILTYLGLGVAYMSVLFIAGLCFRYGWPNSAHEKKAWYLLGCVVVPNVIGLILKVILGRARPELLFSNQEFGFYGLKFSKMYWSFPSGHSITVAALVYGIGMLYPKYFIEALIVGLIVATSRVLLYYHYLSDVLVGFYFSLLIAGLFTHVIKRKYK